MKIIFVWVCLFLLISSCTEEKPSATLRISFPKKMSTTSQNSLKIHSVDGFMSSQWSGQLTQASDVDCFGVFIGGDEAINQRNFCNENITDSRLVNFGDYFAALDRNGDVLEVEIDADVPREVTIIAMSSTDGTCTNFQGLSPPTGHMSHPRIVHQQTYVFQAGTQTVDVVMSSNFDSDDPEIDYCEFDSSDEPTASTPALLSFTTAGPHDYGNVTQGGSSSHTVTIVNNGGSTATSIAEVSLAAPFDFTGGSYPGTAGTCTTTLAAGSSCDLQVDFSPTSAGLQSGTIELSYGSGTNITFTLQGTGVALALLTISDGPTYDYGTVTSGSVNDYTFTLTNSGPVGATTITGSGLAAPYTFKGGSYPGTAGTCTTTLASAANCTIVVTYSPTVVSASDIDTIQIDYNDSSATVQATRAVQGMAVAPALLTISETDPHNYGTLASGAFTNHTFTVTNTGATTATAMSESGLAAPYGFTGGTYPGTGGNCGASLPPAANCTLDIEYAPSGVGVHNDTIDINYNDGVGAQISSRNVTGVGVAPANLTITEIDPYDYGSAVVGATLTHTFTINNTGGFQASALSETGLATPFSFLGGSYPGTGGTCAATLAPAASCDIVIEYAPVATGLQSDTIDINYNDGVSAQISSRDIQGTGIAPASLIITETDPYDFGTNTIGNTVTHVFTVTNAGSATATAISEVGLAAPFNFTGGSYPGTGGTCTTTLTSAANCTIDIEYAPVSTGLQTDTISLSYNNGAAVVTSDRDIQGTGVNPALLVISDGPTFDFGAITNSTTSNKTFTVTNSGGATATSLTDGSGLAAPYSFFGGSYPGTGGTCGATLSSLANCTVVVEFAPTVTTTYPDTLLIDYYDDVSFQTSSRDITGNGVP